MFLPHWFYGSLNNVSDPLKALLQISVSLLVRPNIRCLRDLKGLAPATEPLLLWDASRLCKSLTNFVNDGLGHPKAISSGNRILICRSSLLESIGCESNTLFACDAAKGIGRESNGNALSLRFHLRSKHGAQRAIVDGAQQNIPCVLSHLICRLLCDTLTGQAPNHIDSINARWRGLWFWLSFPFPNQVAKRSAGCWGFCFGLRFHLLQLHVGKHIAARNAECRGPCFGLCFRFFEFCNRISLGKQVANRNVRCRDP
mmetsp:Transcript_124744/g.229978  ORF Transcript_124744/g.229978 Transcript_124744/m.229978 type:complete len:257 (-) Transcript_124744:135-905(-)